MAEKSRINYNVILVATTVISVALNIFQYNTDRKIREKLYVLEKERLSLEKSANISFEYLTLTGLQLEQFIAWANNRDFIPHSNNHKIPTRMKIIRNEILQEYAALAKNHIHESQIEMTLLIIGNNGAGIASDAKAYVYKILFQDKEPFSYSFDFVPPDVYDEKGIYSRPVYDRGAEEGIGLGEIEPGVDIYLPLILALPNDDMEKDINSTHLVTGTMYQPIKLTYLDPVNNQNTLSIRSMHKYEYILNKEAWIRG